MNKKQEILNNIANCLKQANYTVIELANKLEKLSSNNYYALIDYIYKNKDYDFNQKIKEAMKIYETHKLEKLKELKSNGTLEEYLKTINNDDKELLIDILYDSSLTIDEKEELIEIISDSMIKIETKVKENHEEATSELDIEYDDYKALQLKSRKDRELENNFLTYIEGSLTKCLKSLLEISKESNCSLENILNKMTIDEKENLRDCVIELNLPETDKEKLLEIINESIKNDKDNQIKTYKIGDLTNFNKGRLTRVTYLIN